MTDRHSLLSRSALEQVDAGTQPLVDPGAGCADVDVGAVELAPATSAPTAPGVRLYLAT